MNHSDEQVLCDEKEIEQRIRKLAASYTPEWNVSSQTPDVGATIAKLFAKQMSENTSMYGGVIEKYRTEFVNMLDISLRPAKPSHALVLLEPVSHTIPGVEVPRGTKLLAQSDKTDRAVVFETSSSIYVSSAVLETAFMTNGREGRVMPLLGSFEVPTLIPQKQEAADAAQQETDLQVLEQQSAQSRLQSFPLFGRMPDISKNALLFYHERVFDTVDNPLYICIKGDYILKEKIQKGMYRFSYYGEGRQCSFAELSFVDDFARDFEEKPSVDDVYTFRLEKGTDAPELDVVELDGRSYHLLILEAGEPITENISLERVAFSSEGRRQPAQFIHNGTTELDTGQFDLFGDTLSIYQECYIGHDNYFAKAGARITLTFEVCYPEHMVGLTKQQEQDELKIIKRKPRVVYQNTPADTYADEISIEYFNGLGWKKLECQQDYRRLFASGDMSNGRTGYELSFLCPPDWTATAVGAYDSRCLRIQLLKADNCYLRPCVHHYPQITALGISYCYHEHFVEPTRLLGVRTTQKLDYTKAFKEHCSLVCLGVSNYSEDAVYLGFRGRMEEGPISLLFELEEGSCCDGLQCDFAYSARGGFRQMKVVDHTAGFTRTGTVLFMPQSDMAQLSLEGKTMYWLRITRSRPKRADEPEQQLPVIKDIRINAVQAANIETKEEQDFYLDEVLPYMSFFLGNDRILDIDLWVNERDRYSKAQIQELLKTDAAHVRVAYDSRGEITAFFVKWEEVERLDDIGYEKGYVLDRMNNRLLFGDGVHMEIPRITDDVAFKVRVRCCEGQLGNVEAGMINDVQRQFLFLDSVRNPFRAYGGSNMESLDAALARGANILRSRKRLVSISDYEREILAYSDAIAQVRCLIGKKINGEGDPDAVTFVILLKDYRASSFYFKNLAEELRQHLCGACELTLAPEQIHIAEPIFVDVCVDVWAKSMSMEDSFEIRAELTECLKKYLDPVESETGAGWEIGVMPKKNQILMKLNALKSRAIVRKLLLVAKYTDEQGSHEVELSELKEYPFMVCRSGTHHIHLMVDEQ